LGEYFSLHFPTIPIYSIGSNTLLTQPLILSFNVSPLYSVSWTSRLELKIPDMF
jgi:hypothetical protein